MFKLYPDAKPKQFVNWVSQVWPFAHDMKKGDLVVLPLRTQPDIEIRETRNPPAGQGANCAAERRPSTP